MTTSAAGIQDRPALPLAQTCCAPLLREPLTAGQAADLARLLKALADPTRLRLVSMVAAHDGGEACVCELTEPLGLTQPTISHHLKILVEAGIFTRDKRGVWAYYSLVPSALAALSAVLQPGTADTTALSPDELAALRPSRLSAWPGIWHLGGLMGPGDPVPGTVSSPAVWRPADFADPSEWTVTLSAAERDEIVAAAKASVRSGLTAATVRREDFPLPGRAAKLVGWVRELSAGRAFVLIRGFPVDVLSETETELAYVGLGLHLGTPVSQNAAGDLLGHVRDTGVVRDSPAVRLYATSQRQDFHCDGSDLVGLLCLKPAKTGGQSKIVSSMAVYNQMLARRPDLVGVLRQPFAWDRNDEQSPGQDPFFSLPVIFDIDGAPRIFFIGWYIRDAQRHEQAPRLTGQQLEALELLEGIANDPSFYLQMEFAPGDIQLLNNAKILHAREAYTDDDDPAERRHLLRLWLTAHAFASVEDTLRGGIPAQRQLCARIPSATAR